VGGIPGQGRKPHDQHTTKRMQGTGGHKKSKKNHLWDTTNRPETHKKKEQGRSHLPDNGGDSGGGSGAKKKKKSFSIRVHRKGKKIPLTPTSTRDYENPTWGTTTHLTASEPRPPQQVPQTPRGEKKRIYKTHHVGRECRNQGKKPVKGKKKQNTTPFREFLRPEKNQKRGKKQREGNREKGRP